MSDLAIDMAYFAAVILATPTAFVVGLLIVAAVVDMFVAAVVHITK